MENKNLVYNGRLYSFSHRGVKVDDELYCTIKELYVLLDSIVIALGKNKFPDIDTVYYHYHVNHDVLNKVDLIRYIYNLIYRESLEYKLKQEYNTITFIRRFCGELRSGTDVKLTLYFDDTNYNQSIARLASLLNSNPDFSSITITEIF